MVNAKQVAEKVNEIAPFALAQEWDNCGIVLDCGNTTDGVLFALDVTPATLAEAERLGCGILVTHHPALKAPKKQFGPLDPVVMAARKNISLIAAHTCYDVCVGGVNDVLCEKLGISNVTAFGAFGRCGTVDPMPSGELIRTVQGRLGCESVLAVDSGRTVRTVAVVGGSCGDDVALAIEMGFDAMVTGEYRHHDALAAHAAGLCLVGAGHFNTENPAVEPLCEAVGARVGFAAKCLLSREGGDASISYH